MSVGAKMPDTQGRLGRPTRRSARRVGAALKLHRYDLGHAPDPDNPPRDLWCGPYLDPPTARDQEILRIFRAKGVADAFKASKPAAEYGIGAEKCRDCRHFAGGKLGECEKVCGLV